jgi:hypothetical protein
LLFAALFALYLAVSPSVALKGDPNKIASAAVPYEGDAAVRLAMGALLAVLAAAAAVLLLRRRMTAGRALLLLLLGGAVMRFGVMLYTPFLSTGTMLAPTAATATWIISYACTRRPGACRTQTSDSCTIRRWGTSPRPPPRGCTRLHPANPAAMPSLKLPASHPAFFPSRPCL